MSEPTTGPADLGDSTSAVAGPHGNRTPPPLPEIPAPLPPPPVVDPVVIKAQADSLDQQIALAEEELQALSEQRRAAVAAAQEAAARLDDLLQRRTALQRALDWPEQPQQVM